MTPDRTQPVDPTKSPVTISRPDGSGNATRLSTARCVLSACGRKFHYDPGDLTRSSFPFCSPRCRGVDLGNWVDEAYRIEGPEDPDDEAEADADAADVHE